MNRVIVKSVHGAFDYVMEHYYPYGMAAEAAEQGALTDTYATISIQDSHTGGFGVAFAENQFCKGVLTLYFDDIVTEVDGTCTIIEHNNHTRGHLAAAVTPFFSAYLITA